MIFTDEEALICDLAETYQIFDYRSLPVRTAATLSAGLREHSRIKTKLRGEKAIEPEDLLVQVIDMLAGILWLFGGYGELDAPPTIKDEIRGRKNEEAQGSQKRGAKAFATGADFDAAWNRNKKETEQWQKEQN